MSKSTFKIMVADDPLRSQVLLNDQPVAGLRRISFDLDAQSIPFLKLEIYANAVVEGEFVQQVTTITSVEEGRRQGAKVAGHRQVASQ